MLQNKPKTISLFAGAGGCSLGFKQAGFDVIYATDFDKSAIETYKANFPDSIAECKDINDIDFEELLNRLKLKPGELEVLIGGPPCQGFSTAGTRFWDDPRNHLLKQYVRALEIIKPKWFMMENVEGLLTTKNGEYIYQTAKAFIELGYQINIEKVYAHEYGIPQRRKRVVILGNRLGINFTFPKPTHHSHGKIFRHSEVTLEDALSGLPKALSVLERKALLSQGLSEIVTDHYYPNVDGIQQERINALRPGQTMKHLPEELQHISFKRRAMRRVSDGTPTEKRGGPPSGLKRLKIDEPCLTITGAAIREFIHPFENRTLTIRECASIQTFPNSFIFCGSQGSKIQQIGNAIPPQLSKEFALHILKCGFKPTSKTGKGKLIDFSLTKSEGLSPALQKTKSLLSELKKESNQYQLTIFDTEMPINSTVKNLFSKSRILSSGNLPVTLSESELYSILILICNDLNWDPIEIGLTSPGNALPSGNYYDIPLNWFSSHSLVPNVYELQGALAKGIDIDSDFGLYFSNVCSLHKRRVKFQMILSYQPMPTMDQVGPRGLLEYGICNNQLLNSWLVWRKWIYDIDNRSAQETGYLFEPVLASSLGGEAVGARNSPVRRINEDGTAQVKGRQVDCYIGAENKAYEFKLRVTIAASGQGRFAEELSFPRECRAAGITPVLIVLDPTSSARLIELADAFISSGGEVYIGEDAWNHLEEKAGPIMSHFVDNYIKPPLAEINEFDKLSLSSVKLTWDEDKIIIQGDDHLYEITRDKSGIEIFEEEEED